MFTTVTDSAVSEVAVIGFRGSPKEGDCEIFG